MERHSAKRDAIMDYLMTTKAHPSALTVYEALRPSVPGLSLATVYRGLASLRDRRKAVVVCTVNGEERFDGNTAPHAHLVCDKCGSVTDLDGCLAPGSFPVDDIARDYGFIVTDCLLTFHGVCAECSQRSSLSGCD